jgi:hypothetical protein
MDQMKNKMYRSTTLAGLVLGLMGSSALSAPSIRIETIYSFNPASARSTYPEHPGGLIVDEKGNLFGETSDPVFFLEPLPNTGGSVFRLNPPTKGQSSWTKTTLHNFTGSPDGTGDVSIIYSHGNIYGITDSGGYVPDSVNPGAGIAFSLNGQTENILYTFCQGITTGCTDGNPSSLVDDKGVIYGINYASIFSLTPPTGKSGWTESTIYKQAGLSFAESPPNFGNGISNSLLIENDAIYVVGTVIATNQNILFKFTPPTKGQSSGQRQ